MLLRCLAGLDVQTYRDFEVIVVDDGSRDGSGVAAAKACAAGRPVRVLSSAGRGAVSSRIVGVEAARGEIVAFTDSDCVPDRNWLAALVSALTDADAAQGTTLPVRPTGPTERSVSVESEDGLYATCNVAYRRSAYDAAGGFDGAAANRLGFRHGSALRGLGFGEDTLLGWRVRRAGRVVFAPDALVRHEVFPPDLRDALQRGWATGGFPALIAEVPELRPRLWHGVVLGGPSRLALYGACIAGLLGQRKTAAMLLAAWVWARSSRLHPQTGSWRAVVRVLPADLAVDGVTAAALAIGSVRRRQLVL